MSDLISRQMTLEVIDALMKKHHDRRVLLGIVYDQIKDMPSVEQKQCKLCGRWFTPVVRSDEQYCSFPNEKYGGKPCKVAYKRIAQYERGKQEHLKLPKLIYNRLRSQGDSSAVKQFMAERTQMKEALSKDEYIEWLRKKDKETRRR